jgi:hypothetical protein
MQHHSEGLGEDDIQDNINSTYNSLNINPTLASTVGGKLGGLFGPVGNVVGSAIGGKVAGRGNRGISGKIAGSVIGSALLGPVGGLLGYAGGRMGDLHDMEGALGFNNSKTSGLLDTLGYGFGFGDNMNDRMRDYYEIDQYAPANVQPVMGDSEAVGDPFTSLADMFSGTQGQSGEDDGGYSEGYSNPDDGEGMGGMGGFGGGYT